MVRVISRTAPDGEAFEPANDFRISSSGALEVRNIEDENGHPVAAFAPGEWVKATVE